jgi:hypothetical protein
MQHLPAMGGRMNFEGSTGDHRRAFFMRQTRVSWIEFGLIRSASHNVLRQTGDVVPIREFEGEELKCSPHFQVWIRI